MLGTERTRAPEELQAVGVPPRMHMEKGPEARPSGGHQAKGMALQPVLPAWTGGA